MLYAVVVVERGITTVVISGEDVSPDIIVAEVGVVGGGDGARVKVVGASEVGVCVRRSVGDARFVVDDARFVVGVTR